MASAILTLKGVFSLIYCFSSLNALVKDSAGGNLSFLADGPGKKMVDNEQMRSPKKQWSFSCPFSACALYILPVKGCLVYWSLQFKGFWNIQPK